MLIHPRRSVVLTRGTTRGGDPLMTGSNSVGVASLRATGSPRVQVLGVTSQEMTSTCEYIPQVGKATSAPALRAIRARVRVRVPEDVLSGFGLFTLVRTNVPKCSS